MGWIQGITNVGIVLWIILVVLSILTWLVNYWKEGKKFKDGKRKSTKTTTS